MERHSNSLPHTPYGVAVIYPYVPHYRRAVFDQMAVSSPRRYVFCYGENKLVPTIEVVERKISADDLWLQNYSWRGLTIQTGLMKVIFRRSIRHYIFLGDPHILSTWFYALIARALGKTVWLWTHGWLRREEGRKSVARLAFYKLAHGLLLYGERAREIGIDQGVNPNKLHVIYNSLDYQAQRNVRTTLEAARRSGDPLPRWGLGFQEGFYFACISRLTCLCRLDMAIHALAKIRISYGVDIGLFLIGDGPERDALKTLADELGVSCVITGAVYEEKKIGPILYQARAVVSPGKVGLTAMHSLAYGVPVITHDNFDRQMPEFEAITPGITGEFFVDGDIDSLAEVMWNWFKKPRTDQERIECVKVIEKKFSPPRQVELMEAALRRREL